VWTNPGESEQERESGSVHHDPDAVTWMGLRVGQPRAAVPQEENCSSSFFAVSYVEERRLRRRRDLGGWGYYSGKKDSHSSLYQPDAPARGVRDRSLAGASGWYAVLSCRGNTRVTKDVLIAQWLELPLERLAQGSRLGLIVHHTDAERERVMSTTRLALGPPGEGV